MSADIDIRNFTGENADLAAVDPQGATAEQSSTADFPVNAEFLDTPAPPEVVAEEAPSRQELNFRALTDEVERIKAQQKSEREEYLQNIQMLKANLANRPQESQKQTRMFDNLKDDDVPNVSEIRNEWSARETEYQQKIEELQVAQRHSDYAEVLDKYLAPLVREKPVLADAIKGHPTPAAYAYELGKLAQQARNAQIPPPSPPQPSATAQRIVENASKPGTLSQGGGQSALSKADFFESMSDADFIKYASKHLESI